MTAVHPSDRELSAAVANMLGMPNHPNRSKANRSLAANPTPAEIRELRERLGLSQEAAAAVVYSNERTWQNWEAPTDSPENRRMHPAMWELFRIKTGQE